MSPLSYYLLGAATGVAVCILITLILIGVSYGKK